MSIPVVFAAALSPGIFWLWFFLRGRSYQPHPRRLIAGTFFLGMLSVVPAGALEYALAPDLPDDIGVSVGAVAGLMFLVVGPVEELSKFLSVRLGAFRSLHFDEPLDGLVFSAAASLGFASAENVLYAFQHGPEVMIVRGPLSTLAHVVFGMFWGAALAVRRMDRAEGAKASSGETTAPWWGRSSPRQVVLLGLAGAALAHGTFNFMLATGFWWVSVLLVIVGAVRVARLFRWGQRVSPFRLRRNVPVLTCPHCAGRFRLGAKFCDRCGTRTDGALSEIECGRCGSTNRPDARFCTSCGDRFVELN